MSSDHLPREAHVRHHPTRTRGKTTLTEKLLLYGGGRAGRVCHGAEESAVHGERLDGAGEAAGGDFHLESTVLQFDYEGHRINLLDTPGHKDFSEDTYRVLTAVDAAVMVIDAGKGIEAQTRKLFEVCRRRGVPIFTFMNKVDRPTRDPLALVDELVEGAGDQGRFRVNWPLGNGTNFRGVYDRLTHQAHMFERTTGGKYAAPVDVTGLDDPSIREKLDEHVYLQSREEI